MPLIRYKNDDVGALSDKTCPCGRNLPLLEKVDGRALDIIQTPDGKMVAGEFFPHLMKEFEEIEKFQVLQEDLQNLKLNMIKRKELSHEKLSLLKNEISKVMGEHIKIDFHFVEEIPLTESGKFRVVASKVPVNFGNN